MRDSRHDRRLELSLGLGGKLTWKVSGRLLVWFAGLLVCWVLRMQSMGSGDSRRSLGHDSCAHLGCLAEGFSADGVQYQRLRNYKRNKIGGGQYARST
jgi:hypothetical protein